jgi:hypothetical protein
VRGVGVGVGVGHVSRCPVCVSPRRRARCHGRRCCHHPMSKYALLGRLGGRGAALGAPCVELAIGANPEVCSAVHGPAIP